MDFPYISYPATIVAYAPLRVKSTKFKSVIKGEKLLVKISFRMLNKASIMKTF